MVDEVGFNCVTRGRDRKRVFSVLISNEVVMRVVKGRIGGFWELY